MAAPVPVEADVGHSGNASKPGRADQSEKLLPHRCQIDQVAGLPKIFLSDLQLHHVRRALDLVKDGTVRLTRLEVERAVLGLQYDVVHKHAVERLKL